MWCHHRIKGVATDDIIPLFLQGWNENISLRNGTEALETARYLRARSGGRPITARDMTLVSRHDACLYCRSTHVPRRPKRMESWPGLGLATLRAGRRGKPRPYNRQLRPSRYCCSVPLVTSSKNYR